MKYLPIINILLLFTFLNGYAQAPEFDWVSQCGNPPNTTDTKSVLAAGSDGSFFLAGEFLDTADFGNKVMISRGGTDIFLIKNDAAGSLIWSNRIGDTDYDYVQKVAVDESGNVYLAGYFYAETSIGSDHYVSYGSQDIFVAKYNGEGEFVWSFRAGGAMADYITSVVLNADGHLVIAGHFYDTFTIGDTALIAENSSDIFLAMLDESGQLLWAERAGGSSSDQARSLEMDPMGNILLGASFYYDITIGDTVITTENPVGVAIARFLPDGQADVVFQVDGTYLTGEIQLAATSDGGIYMAGNFSDQVTFGSDTFNAGEFNQDIFFARYNPQAELIWARHVHSIASDQVIGIETGQNDHLIVTGHYLDTIHFGLLTLNYTLCCGSREIFIVDYAEDGKVSWGTQISGTRANVKSMELNHDGDLLLSGLFTEEVHFGALTLSHFDGFLNYVSCLKTSLLTQADQPKKASGLKIFPNPAQNRIRLIFPAPIKTFEYRIYSMDGRIADSGKLGQDQSLDLSGLQAARYLLVIPGLNGEAGYSCSFIKSE